MAKTQDDRQQKLWLRHKRIYDFFAPILGRWIGGKFNFSTDGFDLSSIDGPVILIPNHSCAWDPLLISTAFCNRQMYFVASEHILRWRFWGPIISWLVAPIPRKKAFSAAGTVMAILRQIRAGHSVCLFAEGEQTWDGAAGHVFPTTGKLVKQSGATLVTYRLNGAYLSLPRWGKGVRKGKIEGSVTGVYPPEQLKTMKPEEIDSLIDRDIHSDVWKWQEEQKAPVEFIPQKKKFGAADRLDKMLFLCPSCKKLGGLKVSGDSISCGCGFSRKYLPTGYFDTVQPFKSLMEWDAWERAELPGIVSDIGKEAAEEQSAQIVFRDDGAALSRVENGHRDTQLSSGSLTLEHNGKEPILSAGDRSFPLSSIDTMALVLGSTLLFSMGEEYYQIRSEETNLRKYLLVWQQINTAEGR